MIALNKTIRLFLDGIGRREEYEFYLNRFQADTAACFALLCPDRGSIEAGAEVLAFDLHFLLRLGLAPAMLLCGEDAAHMQSILANETIFAFQDLNEGSPDDFIRRMREQERLPVLIEKNADLATTLLRLLPDTARRVHFIRAAGALKTRSGESLAYFHTHKDSLSKVEPLEFDYPALARQLLDARPGTHLSVTSPIHLLQEIFTVKGAGTLFRKGSKILHFSNSDSLDRSRLIGLLESSFGKALARHAFLDAVAHAYIDTDYRGAVLLESAPPGLYLSKFAVGRAARGEGLAQELWTEVCQNHKAFFWRSAAANPFNTWYRQQADGQHRTEKWEIFWRGMPPESISPIITFCLDRPIDFLPHS